MRNELKKEIEQLQKKNQENLAHHRNKSGE